MHKSLLLKLTGLVLVVTLLSVGVTAFFVALFSQATLTDKLELDLASDARLVQYAVEGEWLENPELLQMRINSISQDIGRRITIIDQSGTVVADSHFEISTLENLGGRTEFRLAGREGQGSAVRYSEAAEEEFVYVAISFRDGAIRVASELREINETLRNLYRGLMIITILVALLALIVAYLVNRHITDPLQDILLVVKRLQNGEFGRRVLVRSHDEIGQLGRSFNDLSETLEQLFDTIHDREGKLNAVLSSMDDGVLAVNMQRKVILANKAVSELTGIDERSIIGKDQVEIIRNVELAKILSETMLDEKTLNKEIKLYPGSERILAVTSSPLESDDATILGAVAVLRDVTDLRRLELMRKEFVANVSHELRTPLTSIKGFVETILNGQLDDKALLERFLRIVNGETDRMITLINDLLDLSRIESGKQVINLEPVDIGEIFEYTITMLQSKADAKGITVENRIPEGVFVEGDTKLLRQVAINLVDNGIKYTQPEGKVWVEASTEKNEVIVTVADNGVGIPDEHLHRVFERFYRVDKGRSRNMGGTGLGLSIVKHIVEKHKGIIHAQSKVGEGTRMCFTLKRVDS